MLQVTGQDLVLATHLMVAVPERGLGPSVANLLPRYDEIVAAIDMTLNGFYSCADSSVTVALFNCRSRSQM